MHLPEWDEFVSLVVRQVRFSPDRKDIKRELTAHLEDACDARMAAGQSELDASREAVASMGNPVEIGRELNRAHNAVIGWTWLISKWVFIVLILILGLNGSLFVMIADLFAAREVGYEDLNETYSVGEAVYTIEVDESQRLGQRTVTLDEVQRRPCRGTVQNCVSGAQPFRACLLAPGLCARRYGQRNRAREIPNGQYYIWNVLCSVHIAHDAGFLYGSGGYSYQR